MTLRAELIHTAAALRALAPAWDHLAVAAARPYCAPGWMLAWWKHVGASATAGRELWAVAVRDGPALVAVAPLFLAREGFLVRCCRPLATETAARVEPVAAAGREAEAAAAISACLAGSTPAPDLLAFENIPASSPWPDLLAAAWPGGARVVRGRNVMAPTLDLAGRSFEEWLATKAGRSRRRMMRGRRALEELGAHFRLSEPDLLDRDLVVFAALHHARWRDRGGSAVLTDGVERMLASAGAELVGDGRFRLWCLDVDGQTIAAELFLAAGGELASWLGGFDEAWAEHQPSFQTLLAAIEDGFSRGERRVDHGPGAQGFKYRLADGEEVLETAIVVPRGRRSPLVSAHLLPGRLRRVASRRLPARVKAPLKRVLGEG